MQFVINGLRYIGTVISYTRTPPLPLLNRMDRWQAVNATFIRLANIDTSTVYGVATIWNAENTWNLHGAFNSTNV